MSALTKAVRCVSLFALASMFLASCANPIVASVEPTPTPVPTPIPPQKPTFKVTKGSITDIIQSIGRVVAVEQQDLYFRVPGHLDTITVTIQDKVKKGQVLASLDTENLAKQIQAQQSVIDVAKLNIQKAKQDAATANAGKQSDISIAEAGVQQAQARLDIENAKLAAMKAGPNPDAVAKAQTDVAKAQADLQRVQAAQLANQANIASAQAGVVAAQAKLTAVKASSQSALTAAQSALAAAQAKLDALKAGPRAEQLTALQLAVTQAKNALYAEQITRDAACGNSNNQTGCQAENAKVNAAQTVLDNANKQLALATAGPNPTDLAAAQADLDKAKAAYDAVNQAVQQGTDVASAQADLDKAKAASDAAVSAAKQGDASVASARASVDQAIAVLHLVQNPSTPSDIQQQASNVESAQAGIAAAQAAVAKAKEIAGVTVSAETDIAILQKQADQAQLQLDALNKTLADNTITAPFDGIVISATGQPGDNVLAYTPVITVANPATLQIAVDVPADQIPKIALGQKATLVMDAFPATTINAVVDKLPTIAIAGSTSQNPNAPGSSTGTDPNARGAVVDRTPKLKVNWPGPGVELGQLARVTITAQQKDDVLKIPTRTLNKITNRTFVMVMDKNGKQHPQDITIGISTTDETEVLTGLKEGDTVVSR